MSIARKIDGIQVTPWTGQFSAPSGSAFQMPSILGSGVKLIAHPANKGVCWFGFQSGTVNDHTGIPLNAAQETDVMDVDNLNRFYVFFERQNDTICYMVLIHVE